jgi:hypothetical protein
VITAIEKAIANYGVLVNNFNICKNLARAISAGDHSFNTVPALLEDVIENGRWLDRINPYSEVRIEMKPHEFRRFIEMSTPEGLATTDAEVRRYLGTPRLIDLYNKATVSDRGASEGEKRNPDGLNQHHWINPNNVRVNPPEPDPVVIPIRARDRSSEPKAGNSAGYALRRLSRDRPDLHAQVIAGEVTPHGAMVLAGFAPKQITIPDDPVNAARRLAKHFHGERLDALIAALESRR